MADKPLHLAAVVSNTEPAIMPGPEPLTGQHVTLERLAHSHLYDLYENVGSHDDMWTWLSDGPFSTASIFIDWLSPIIEKSDEYFIYAVIPLSGTSKGKAVGIASLLGANLMNRVIEVGLLYSPQLRMTTAATEVIFLFGCLLFEKLNYRRLEWKCNSLNLASKKAAERYGFVYEGTIRQIQIVKGRNRDTCWYSMLDTEWPMCRKVFDWWLQDGNFDEQQRQRSRMKEIRESLR
ncbi:hypothetical protein MMC34_005097 [Xylographa carneopallida]|nr:hypothetical protein [Xylographa carneopallida]